MHMKYQYISSKSRYFELFEYLFKNYKGAYSKYIKKTLKYILNGTCQITNTL